MIIISRFQKENLSAAVASRAGSGVTSLATSRRGSCVSVSRGVSRGVSRVNSCDSLDTGGHVTGTMEQIRHVTETQDPVMSFYFTQDDKEVRKYSSSCAFDHHYKTVDFVLLYLISGSRALI